MSTLATDASNSSIPTSHPLITLIPPLPTTSRGEPLVIDGNPGTFNKNRPVLIYPAGKLVVIRELEAVGHATPDNPEGNRAIKAFVYRGHTAPVTSAKFSPSGRYVASVDMKGKLRVWSYDHEDHLCKLDMQILPGMIRDVAWDGDGKRICVAGEGGSSAHMHTKCVQWDTGVQSGVMGGHTKRALSIAMRQKRPYRIMSGGEDQRCVFYVGPPFKSDGTRTEHSNTVNCVRYSHNSEYIASVGSDKKIVLYDGKTGEIKEVYQDKHSGSIYSCAWSENDSMLLTCSADKTVHLMSIPDGATLQVWDMSQSVASSVSASSKQSMMVACTFCLGKPVVVGVNGLISILDMNCNCDDKKNEVSATTIVLSGHQVSITAMTIDGNKNVYTSDIDGVICKWMQSEDDCNDWTPVRVTGGAAHIISGAVHGGIIKSIDFMNSNGGQPMLLSAGWDDVLRVSDPLLGEAQFEVAIGAQPSGSACGEKFLFVFTVCTIVTFADDGQMLSTMEISYGALSGCVSSDESILCIGGDDKNIHVYSISNDGSISETNVVSGHAKPVSAVSFSPNGSLLASGDAKDVYVWNVADWSCNTKGRWCFHTNTITSLAWSPDGNVLASAGHDENIFLWCLAKKMRRIHYSFCHRGGVTVIAFLDNDSLLSVGGDGCLCKWNVGGDISKKFG
mmetsp:Transcript_27987/g.43503  ORF Transcript_27987/g.43503 Transcript_27987/m.43503 type:complete len:675 (-) Transcript_27987:286-2310(-)